MAWKQSEEKIFKKKKNMGLMFYNKSQL